MSRAGLEYRLSSFELPLRNGRPENHVLRFATGPESVSASLGFLI